jgi:hypothetical protein
MTTNNDTEYGTPYFSFQVEKTVQLLAVYMRDKYPELEMEYVFTDSGCELPRHMSF